MASLSMKFTIKISFNFLDIINLQTPEIIWLRLITEFVKWHIEHDESQPFMVQLFSQLTIRVFAGIPLFKIFLLDKINLIWFWMNGDVSPDQKLFYLDFYLSNGI